MASQGKRMVPEDLIKMLKDLKAAGITAEDIKAATNKHLYVYNFVCYFTNSYDNTQYIYFTIPSTEDLEITIDNLKALIGDTLISVSSTVNSVAEISLGGRTLVAYIKLYEGDIELGTVADEETVEYTDLTIDDRTTKIQLF